MIRLWLANRMKWRAIWAAQTRTKRRAEVIDLETREWRRLDDTAPDLRGHP